MKYYYVKYEARGGANGHRESGVLKAANYKTALKMAIRAKRLFVRYGWEEICADDEVKELSPVEYGVLKRYILDIDSFFDENLRLRIA